MVERLQSLNERHDFRRLKRNDIGILGFWKITIIGWIMTDISEDYGLLQTAMHDAINIVYGFGR